MKIINAAVSSYIQRQPTKVERITTKTDELGRPVLDKLGYPVTECTHVIYIAEWPLGVSAGRILGSHLPARWYPLPKEVRDCCKKVHHPTLNNPSSLLRHCRSYVHVAALWNVDVLELKREVKIQKKYGDDEFLKAIARTVFKKKKGKQQ